MFRPDQKLQKRKIRGRKLRGHGVVESRGVNLSNEPSSMASVLKKGNLQKNAYVLCLHTFFQTTDIPTYKKCPIVQMS